MVHAKITYKFYVICKAKQRSKKTDIFSPKNGLGRVYIQSHLIYANQTNKKTNQLLYFTAELDTNPGSKDYGCLQETCILEEIIIIPAQQINMCRLRT